MSMLSKAIGRNHAFSAVAGALRLRSMRLPFLRCSLIELAESSGRFSFWNSQPNGEKPRSDFRNADTIELSVEGRRAVTPTRIWYNNDNQVSAPPNPKRLHCPLLPAHLPPTRPYRLATLQSGIVKVLRRSCGCAYDRSFPKAAWLSRRAAPWE